jgi:hypothetical protein
MTRIETQTWWFNQPVLDECESLLIEVRANYTQGKRAVGGKLFGTTQRLLFVPNRMDRRLGGRIVTIPRDEISSVTKADATWAITEIFSGAHVPRMSVLLRDGTQYMFVVNSIDANIATVNSYLIQDDHVTDKG